MADYRRFQSDKSRVLGKADLSRKGSVDEKIRDLVDFINSRCAYYTTSSCSGRVVVFVEENKKKKKGCKWLLVSHTPVEQSELIECLSVKSPGDHDSAYSILKFEAFILHVVCRSFTDAQTMLQVALGNGFRNSGISCGKKGRLVLAIRSTLGLEVPVAYTDQLLVSHEYLGHLADLVTIKMKENEERIDNFYVNLKKILEENQSGLAAAPNKQHLGHRHSCFAQKVSNETETVIKVEEDFELGDLFSEQFQ